MPQISNETRELFANLSNMYDEITNWDDFCNTLNTADESLIAFLRDANYGTKDLAAYQQYLKDTGRTTNTFAALTSKAGTILKSLGASMASIGINLGISAAIALVIKLIDMADNSLEKQQDITENLRSELTDIRSEISAINSELNTTADRINELRSKDHLSFIEQKELKNLTATNEKLKQMNLLLTEQEAEKQREAATP